MDLSVNFINNFEFCSQAQWITIWIKTHLFVAAASPFGVVGLFWKIKNFRLCFVHSNLWTVEVFKCLCFAPLVGKITLPLREGCALEPARTFAFLPFFIVLVFLLGKERLSSSRSSRTLTLEQPPYSPQTPQWVIWQGPSLHASDSIWNKKLLFICYK